MWAQVVLPYLLPGLKNQALGDLFTSVSLVFICPSLLVECERRKVNLMTVCYRGVVDRSLWTDDECECLTLLFVHSLVKRTQTLLKRPRSFQEAWRKLKSFLEM